ncbi:MAG: hypothetical protein ABI411_16795, partial [Tahibacter sp.]
NGLTLNGLTFNGLTLNGRTFNGLTLNGRTMNGLTLNGFTLNGMLADQDSVNVSATPPIGRTIDAPWSALSLDRVQVRLHPQD